MGNVAKRFHIADNSANLQGNTPFRHNLAQHFINHNLLVASRIKIAQFKSRNTAFAQSIGSFTHTIHGPCVLAFKTDDALGGPGAIHHGFQATHKRICLSFHEERVAHKQGFA